MARWASRIIREITNVCIHKLQEITSVECLAEGTLETAKAWSGPITVEEIEAGDEYGIQDGFRHKWDNSYYKDRVNDDSPKNVFAWHNNPLVRAFTFEQLRNP